MGARVGGGRWQVRPGNRGWSWGFVADDLVLVANELAVNAIEHAKSAFTVALSLEAGAATVEVADGSPRSYPKCDRPRTSRPAVGGLQIVDTLSARWGVRKLSTGKEVWADLDVVATNPDAPRRQLESR